MQPKVKRIYLPKLKVIVTVVVAATLVLVAARLYIWVNAFSRSTGLTPPTLTRLILNTGAVLKSAKERTNILILGAGGGSHEGSDLTDTILVASIDVRQKAVALISVPRDVWSDTLKDRVNSAYHYGEEKKQGGGLVMSKAIIEDVVGLPLHYAMMINFSGFKDVIDLVDGIDVIVPQGFSDENFPIEGKEDDTCDGDPLFRCRYQTVSFDAGVNHMDGQRALVYVRSRHAAGDEGSDFARNRRQQDVLVALRQKMSNPRMWLSAKQSAALIRAFDTATDTDMNLGELLTLGKAAARVAPDGIQKISIDHLLYVPPTWVYGRYALAPIENFAAIHSYIQTAVSPDSATN